MRRGPAVAVLLCLVGAFLVLVAAGRAWVEVDVVGTPLLPGRSVDVTGGDLVPGLSALGLAGLAGVLALAASRGLGRLVVGGVLLAVGAGVVALVLAQAVSGFGEAARGTAAVAEAGGAGSGAAGVTPWPWACLLGGLLLVAAGLLVAVRGATWAALGRRYEPPAAQAAAPGPVAERGLWEALDRGEDPTAADPHGG